MGKRESSSRPTTERSDCGQVCGGPSGESDQSCWRINAPTSPPPERKCREWSAPGGLPGALTLAAAKPWLRLFPLDRRGRLARYVVDHAVDPAHFVGDAVADPGDELVRQVGPVRRH